MTHRRWEKKITRMFESPVSPRAANAIVAHVAQCESCKAHYNRYRHLESALGQDLDAPPALAMERINAVVVHRSSPPARPMWLSPIGLGSAAAALALALVIGIIAPAIDSPPQPPEWATRSGAVSPDAGVGFRVLRIDSEGVQDVEQFRITDTVTFTYTNTSKDLRYMALWVIDEEGAAVRYYPREQAEPGLQLASNVVDEPLGHGFVLSERHTPGRHQIIALFSLEPITDRATVSAMDAARELGFPWGDLGTQLEGVVATSAMIEIQSTQVPQ